MEYRNEIIEAIHLGLRKGYLQNLEFRNKWIAFEDKMTEYLLTVAVAKQLHKLDCYKKNISIQIEYPLYKFYNNAFPEYLESDNIFAKNLLIREYNTKNLEKRLDIAVMYEEKNTGNYCSLHGLEIKAINIDYNRILKDVKRLANSMIKEKDITGPNSIKSCYAAFIKTFTSKNQQLFKSKIDEKIRQTQIILNLRMKKFIECKENFLSLRFRIEYKEIETNYLEDCHDEDTQTGSVLGIVIEITRK